MNLRRILNLKSLDAVQMFWQHVPKASKKVEVKLQMLSDDGVITFDEKVQIRIIEKHFQRKFCTQRAATTKLYCGATDKESKIQYGLNRGQAPDS